MIMALKRAHLVSTECLYVDVVCVICGSGLYCIWMWFVLYVAAVCVLFGCGL